MSSLILSIQTIHMQGPGGLKALRPDKDGFFRDVPVSVIGRPSRNRMLYTPGSFVKAMSNPDSLFYKSLTEGNLEGEWQHPIINGMSEEEAVNRILFVDRTQLSHYFSRIYTKSAGNGDYVVVYADVKPFGPYGDLLRQSFEDGHRDTTFSLRSATSRPRPLGDGNFAKDIIILSTFDAVGTPGYAEASKRFAIGKEGWSVIDNDSDDIEVSVGFETLANNMNVAKAVGFEHCNSQELLDIFQADKIMIRTDQTVTGVLDRDIHAIRTTGGLKSVFHSLF